MIHPSELPKIMAQLYDELCAYMGYKFPDVSLWPIYRLDVCYNWLLKDENEATYAMDFLTTDRFSKKDKKHLRYFGYVQRICIYRKILRQKVLNLRSMISTKSKLTRPRVCSSMG